MNWGVKKKEGKRTKMEGKEKIMEKEEGKI